MSTFDHHQTSSTLNSQSYLHSTFNLQPFHKKKLLESTIKMRYTAILAFAATAFAAPLEERQTGLCSSGSPLCCATDILNLAILDCQTRTSVPISSSICPHNSVHRFLLTTITAPTTPTGINSFIDICAAEGQQAKCCLLPILEQALICTDVQPQAAPPTVSAA
jgi:hypothetical protein